MSVKRLSSKENVITIVHTHTCAHTHNFYSTIQKNQFAVFIKMDDKIRNHHVE